MSLGFGAEMAPSVPTRHPAIGYLVALVGAAFAVAPATFRSPGRGTAKESRARQVAMYLAHTRLGLSYTAAAACFGRDRTTAAHACRMVEEQREDPALDAIVDLLERAVDVLSATVRS
jgi:chromosomal replication initiation ATPase DnaA